MKMTSFSSATTLIFSLLVAAVPFGTGCVTEVDDGEGSDGSALEADDEPCEAGESRECALDSDESGVGVQTCSEIEGVPTWGDCTSSSSSTPLVLSFDGGAVEYVTTMGGAFDLTGLGASVATDWPTAATPWLALDRDGDGAIGGGEELFGSATVLSSGARADNGFTALRELDTNSDGWITPEDEGFSRLVLWSDRDANRASGQGELATLASRGVTAIALSYARAPRCDARGNCEIERATFQFDDGLTRRTGAIIDVHLKWQ